MCLGGEIGGEITPENGTVDRSGWRWSTISSAVTVPDLSWFVRGAT